MPTVTIIGGGSAKFVRELVVDFFSFDELANLELRLMDVSAERVDRSKRLVQKIIADRKLSARVWATTDQRRALDGADYVIITIMVGGYEHYRTDVAIPAEYGVYQAISDTTGPGAVMRIIRTAPVLRKIAADLAELAPQAWILNYANPMSMNVWTLLDAGHARTVGLCHSIQGCLIHQIGPWLGIPYEQFEYAAGGINHINFYLKLRHKGQDVYPRLLAERDRLVKAMPMERARFELLEHLGHFPAEGPWHQVEYYPWFHKNQKAVDHYAVGAFKGYEVDFENFKARSAEIDAQIAGKTPIDYHRSTEYGVPIIHSLHTGQTRTFYGNVRNGDLINNLPASAIAEVPCLVDRNGIFPCRVGAIPPQLAAVMRPHVAVQQLAVAAVQRKDRRLVERAIAADPLAGSILTLPQIRDMTAQLLAENADYVADWPG